MDWVTSITSLTLIGAIGFYLFSKWRYGYWKRRGVEYLEPELIFGNSRGLIKRELSFGDQFAEFYAKLKQRGVIAGGVFLSIFPVFISVDLEFIKTILQKDFNHFVNRGLYFDEDYDPLQAHLVNLENDRWRHLRTKLTPAFTSGE